MAQGGYPRPTPPVGLPSAPGEGMPRKPRLDVPLHTKVSMRSSRALIIGKLLFGLERAEMVDAAIKLYAERMELFERARELAEEPGD